MTASLRWLLAIVGLLAANVIAMVVLAVSAQGHRVRVVPDYYERAIHHDQVLDEAARSARLGWQVDVELLHDAILVAVHDAKGAPISGRVNVHGSPRVQAGRAFEVELHAIGSGRYRAARINDRGWHDLVVSIDTPGARDTQRLATEAP